MDNTATGTRSRSDEFVGARCPRPMRTAIEEIARRELISASDYVRRALLAQLRADGIELTETS